MTHQWSDGNLVSLSWPGVVLPETTSSPSTPRTFTPQTYFIGISPEGYYRVNYANRIVNPVVTPTMVSMSTGASVGYGFGFVIAGVSAGESLRVVCTITGRAGGTYIAWYDANGTYISYSGVNNGAIVTAPAGTATAILILTGTNPNTYYEFTNIGVYRV